MLVLVLEAGIMLGIGRLNSLPKQPASGSRQAI